MADPAPILVIDDEAGSRESMAIALEKAGYGVRTFDGAGKALEYLNDHPAVRLAICDVKMPGVDGLEFLNQVRDRDLDLGVMLVTGFGSIESAVQAMQVGADDYLTKPVDLYELQTAGSQPAREPTAQGGGDRTCVRCSTSATASRASSATPRPWSDSSSR